MHEGLKPKFEDQNGPLPGRVSRGGCWNLTAVGARAAYRGRHYPGGRFGDLGLRLCRDVSYPDPKPSPRSDNAEQG